MSESDTALYDEEALNDELPDAALEIAGSKLWEGPAASVTAAFCSGIGQLPDISPEINALHISWGRFFPGPKQATACDPW
jgi:hypothetical protein